MAKKIDITGKRFGNLLVIKIYSSIKYRTKWVCQCDCSNIAKVRIDHLRSGLISSCGCKQKSIARQIMTKRNLKHGHAIQYRNTPTYISWKCMIARCSNPNIDGYKYYGGRDINVCERWKDFSNFLLDMGIRPNNKTIDRIDPNKSYEPSNCRWATIKEQNNNRRYSLYDKA